MHENSSAEQADVVVVGGGPAGSAVALRLARQNARVVQLERRVFLDPHNDPIRSGEGLVPGTVRELAALGIDAGAPPWLLSRVQQVRVCWLDGAWTREEIAGRGGIVQIDRELFDYHLFRAAGQAGADGRQGWSARRLYRDGRGRVAGVVAQPPGDHPPQLIRAPIVVDAGGRNALTIRELDLRVQGAGCDFFAISMFFDQVAGLDPGVWEMHLFDPQRMTVVQLSRLRDGLVRCGLGTAQQVKNAARCDSQSFFWARVRHSPDLARRLAGSQVVRRPFVRACLGYEVRQAAFDGLLLVGDAAGYLNPLFGDGILRALTMARHAAATISAALRSGDCSCAGLAAYARWRTAMGRVDRLARGLIQGAYRHPRTLDRFGRLRLVHHALFAALLRD